MLVKYEATFEDSKGAVTWRPKSRCVLVTWVANMASSKVVRKVICISCDVFYQPSRSRCFPLIFHSSLMTPSSLSVEWLWISWFCKQAGDLLCEGMPSIKWQGKRKLQLIQANVADNCKHQELLTFSAIYYTGSLQISNQFFIYTSAPDNIKWNVFLLLDLYTSVNYIYSYIKYTFLTPKTAGLFHVNDIPCGPTPWLWLDNITDIKLHAVFK